MIVTEYTKRERLGRYFGGANSYEPLNSSSFSRAAAIMGRKNADTRSSSPTTAAIRSSRQKMDMYKVAMEKQDRERMEELERLEELQRVG